MKNNLKILVLEDDVMDVELISRTLERAGMECSLTVVDGKTDYETAVGNYRFDVILADNSLPQFDALSALHILQQKNLDTPFILVTGTVSEEFAVAVIHQGADDYILKNNLKKLPSAIEGAIAKWKIKKEKIQAEKALRESEQRFRILFEQAADGILICDTSGRLLDANTSACIMSGYTLDELMRMTIYDNFFKEDLESQSIRMEDLISGKSIINERKIKRKDNSKLYVELSAKLLPDGRVQTIVRDVSYRKHLEAQLLHQKVKHQKKLAQATLDIQEKERAELGRELHDNINQILTASKLLLNAALQDPSIRDEMLELSISNVSKAIEEIRKLSKSLVAPAVNELSLMETIRDMADTIQITTPLTINMTIGDGTDARINSQQQIALYRIVQEQLNNIIKYAEAQEVQIKLDQKDDIIELRIVDDGKGFDVQAKRSGIGFSNMQSRAELLNGKLEVFTEPGKGCVVNVKLPMETHSAEQYE